MSRGTSSLTGTGAVALALVLGLAAALYDVLTGPGLGTVFAVVFVLACTAAAASVCRRDLAVAVVSPPLVYVVIALVSGVAGGGSAAGGFLVRHVMDLFTALVLEAPALLAATGAALVVALLRGLGRRRATADV